MIIVLVLDTKGILTSNVIKKNITLLCLVSTLYFYYIIYVFHLKKGKKFLNHKKVVG